MKCKVLLNNDAVTVIDYAGVEVQIPAIKCNKHEVNVICDEGRYIVVADDYENALVEGKPKKKKKATKKTKEVESCIVFE